MLTKFKSTIIKQGASGKLPSRRLMGGGWIVYLPLTQLHHPLIEPLISAGETEDSRPVQFV